MMLQVFFWGYFIGWWSEDERWCTNQNQAHGVLRVKGNRDNGRWHKGKFVSKYDTICVYNCGIIIFCWDHCLFLCYTPTHKYSSPGTCYKVILCLICVMKQTSHPQNYSPQTLTPTNQDDSTVCPCCVFCLGIFLLIHLSVCTCTSYVHVIECLFRTCTCLIRLPGSIWD